MGMNCTGILSLCQVFLWFALGTVVDCSDSICCNRSGRKALAPSISGLQASVCGHTMESRCYGRLLRVLGKAKIGRRASIGAGLRRVGPEKP